MKLEDKAKEIYQEMVSDLTATAEGSEAWKEAEEIVQGSLMEWANAKAQMLLGDEVDKKAAAIVIKYSSQAIEDVKDAVAAKLSTYLVDKIVSELKGILIKHLLPALV